MNRNGCILLWIMGLACFLSSPVSGRPAFDFSRDLLIAQFDSNPDPDDLMAQVALGSMLKHADLAGVNYYAVAGAYGRQPPDGYISEPILFELSFGPENTAWTDANDDWDASVIRIRDTVRPVLEQGGRVWVQEAGQSDITADWVKALLDDGIPESTVKKGVVVVQHSVWNEKTTTDEALAYVKEKTAYTTINNGNAPIGANDNRGAKTPGYRTDNPEWLTLALSPRNTNTAVRTLWQECVNALERSWDKEGNEAIRNGGVDFSDCVENWWIFNIGSKADNIENFWDRYVVKGVNYLRITVPENEADFEVGENVRMEVEALDADGIDRIEFRLNGNWKHSDASAPYNMVFSDLPAGTHTLTASKVDGKGNWSSTLVTVHVKSPTQSAAQE